MPSRGILPPRVSLPGRLAAVNQVPAVPESGHVILCGLNELGYQTLEELRRLGEEVVVVARTPREEFAAGARALGVTLLEGSYRQERVLRSAGAQTANALVVTEDDDVGNVHAALVAHDLNPGLRLRLRMFNQELGNRPHQHGRISAGGAGDINLRDAPGPLELYGMALMLFGTGTLTVLFALFTDAIVSARLARARDPLPRLLSDHVVVCGLGNIGYRVVEQLAPLGVSLVAVELDRSNRFLPAMQRLGVPVLARDSRLRDTLQTLQVTSARSLVVVTSSDTVNLETALSARALRPDLRVVLRLFDADLAARVERTFGFHSCRSPSALAAPAFAAAAVGEHVIASIPPGRRVLLVARLRVGRGSRAAGETVAAFEQAIHGRVLTVVAGGEQRWCPAGDTPLVPDEDLTVVVTRQGLAEALAYIEASETLGHKE